VSPSRWVLEHILLDCVDVCSSDRNFRTGFVSNVREVVQVKSIL
jgi:hypothetical protein